MKFVIDDEKPHVLIEFKDLGYNFCGKSISGQYERTSDPRDKGPSKLFLNSYAGGLSRRTIIHETGHILGIHHQYPDERSFMSYHLDAMIVPVKSDIEKLINAYSK